MADPTVSAMLAEGATLEEVIAALSEEKEQLEKKVQELEKITPKRIRSLRDGATLIWRCPDDEIPLEITG